MIFLAPFAIRSSKNTLAMQRDKSIIQEAHSTGCAENYAILHRQMMNVFFKFFHGLDVYNVFIFFSDVFTSTVRAANSTTEILYRTDEQSGRKAILAE